MKTEREYLGDGVYAESAGWNLKLLVSNGMQDTNVIHLDPEVLAALLRYIGK